MSSDRTITYNPATHMYDLTLEGAAMGAAESYVAGENILDQILYNRLQNPAYRMSQLANEYSKARSEGRFQDAARLKLEAMRMKAASLEIEFSAFEAEYAAYVAEKRAA